MPGRLKPHILLFLVNLLYAGNYTIAKLAMPAYISPSALVFIRGATGALLFFLIHAMWVGERVERQDWMRFILCGLFGVAINQLLFFKGLSLTEPINASLIMITVPIMVMLIASVTLKERINGIRALGVLLGMTGAATIIISGKALSDLSVSRGDLYILMNATSYAIYLVLVKSLMARYEPFTVMRWIFFFGFLMIIPFGVAELGDVDWANLPASAWWAIIYVLIGVTILTYLLNAMALKISSATLVSTYIYLQPLLATFIAIGFGKDTLTLKKALAGILIFTGVYLVSRRVKPLS